MIPFEYARSLLQQHVRPLAAQQKSLDEAVGHVLAESVHARCDLPRFTGAAMDGYAVRVRDVAEASEALPVRLSITDHVAAGARPRRTVKPGCAARIFTGALLPRGADAVVMQEHVQKSGDDIIVHKKVKPGQNIRYAGEEYARGDHILAAGTVCTPAVIGLLATLGLATVRVQARPAVTLIVTGNELIQPGRPLSAGRIYDANSFSLHAALQCMHITTDIVRVPDDPTSLRTAVADALTRSDCVITSGGVADGDHDHVRDVFRALRIREHFHRVAIKPGKPIFFGTRGKRLVFGLPGNPVSALLGLYLFVRPALALQCDLPMPDAASIAATLHRSVKKKPGRLEFVRASLHTEADGSITATPVSGQGSHMLGGMAAADALIRVPAEAEILEEGTVIPVERIEWSLS
jgi:molybdopterin molybdotransferase